MTENRPRKTRFAALIGAASFLCLLPQLALAGSVPSLMDVKEVIVRPARIGNDEASGTCGISMNMYTQKLAKILKELDVPAYTQMQAPKHREKVAQIDLIPEIVTLRQQGFDCISWVSLDAQSRETVAIPPVTAPRNVVVTYWRGGLLISSNKTVHAAAVRDGLEKLLSKFSKQYQIDQPPPLPTFD